MADDSETFLEALERKIIAGTADMDAAKHIAERTGNPRLLKAFRRSGYRVSRVSERPPTPSEAERERAFGTIARELLDRPAGEPRSLLGAGYETRYVMSLLRRAVSGNTKAAEELAGLVEAPPSGRSRK